jgi:hypothetical protein
VRYIPVVHSVCFGPCAVHLYMAALAASAATANTTEPDIVAAPLLLGGGVGAGQALLTNGLTATLTASLGLARYLPVLAGSGVGPDR